jgi:hypothetical protein
MRDIKTLLTLLRDRIQLSGIEEGLCREIAFMPVTEGMITEAEYHCLLNYVREHKPWHARLLRRSYWWVPGWAAPRVRWLNRQIKKQGSFCSPAHVIEFTKWKDDPKNEVMEFRVRIPGAEIRYKIYGHKEDYDIDGLYQYWLTHIKK